MQMGTGDGFVSGHNQHPGQFIDDEDPTNGYRFIFLTLRLCWGDSRTIRHETLLSSNSLAAHGKSLSNPCGLIVGALSLNRAVVGDGHFSVKGDAGVTGGGIGCI